jgi:hypothetical protein
MIEADADAKGRSEEIQSMELKGGFELEIVLL